MVVNCAAPAEPDERDRTLIAAVQSGLPLVSRPYALVGEITGMSEAEVIARLKNLLEQCTIKRLGVVVRHHELGYRANAMVVWDLPDGLVDAVGERMRGFGFVTLCYRRPRRPPEWPYNLFCMIHGRDRGAVLSHLSKLTEDLDLKAFKTEVLFSLRRFKQCGALYIRPPRQALESWTP